MSKNSCYLCYSFQRDGPSYLPYWQMRFVSHETNLVFLGGQLVYHILQFLLPSSVRRLVMTELWLNGILNLTLINYSNKYYSNLYIQRILAWQAKIVLFMTFWTNIEPYHMFYIIIYVTLKTDRTWKLFLFSCYLNSIISILL